MRVKNPLRSLVRVVLLKAPIEAQVVVTRRCNLSCGYCTEYDRVSELIPLESLKWRIDALHRLRFANITLLGGEPLLHPQIPELVAYAGAHAQVSITTNGFLLSDRLIHRLNEAGLSNMQVSVDAVHREASGCVQKTLRALAPKLECLKRLATFDTHVNVVLCESSKGQFEALVNELRRLSFPISVGLVHDERGMVDLAGSDCLDLWEHLLGNGPSLSFIEYEYGRQLLQGRRPAWKCRAGARYLYVDEYGKAQFCSAQRGRLEKPVHRYTRRDIRLHSRLQKGCELGCSIFCAYRASQIDNEPLMLLSSACAMVLRVLLHRTGRSSPTKLGAPPALERRVSN